MDSHALADDVERKVFYLSSESLVCIPCLVNVFLDHLSRTTTKDLLTVDLPVISIPSTPPSKLGSTPVLAISDSISAQVASPSVVCNGYAIRFPYPRTLISWSLFVPFLNHSTLLIQMMYFVMVLGFILSVNMTLLWYPILPRQNQVKLAIFHSCSFSDGHSCWPRNHGRNDSTLFYVDESAPVGLQPRGSLLSLSLGQESRQALHFQTE